MRITIIHCSFIYTGGGERIILEQIKYLKALGHEVDCYAPIYDPKKCFPDVITQYNIKTFLPQLPEWVPLRYAIVLLLSCIMAPIFSLKFAKTDVFLGENQPGVWIAFVVSKMLNKPFVAYLNHPNRILYPRENEDWAAVKDFKYLSLVFGLIKPLVKFFDSYSIKAAFSRLVNGFFIGKEIEKIYRCNWIGCPSGGPHMDEYTENTALDRINVTGMGYLPAVRTTAHNIALENSFKRVSFLNQAPLSSRFEVNYLKDFVGGRLNSNFSSHFDLQKLNALNSWDYTQHKYILYTGRHQPWKRINWLIEMFKLVCELKNDVYLIVRGPFTPHTKYLMKLTGELGIEDKVIFMDDNGQKELLNLYKFAQVYAFPSEKEDFGIVVIEAMGQGLPVVAWNKGGPTDSVIDGETGFLVDPYNKNLYAHRIIQLLENKALRESMGEAGKKRVRQHFSWERHIAVLEEQLIMAVSKQ